MCYVVSSVPSRKQTPNIQVSFSRLSWEEESNVSTGDDNSPAGKDHVIVVLSL